MESETSQPARKRLRASHACDNCRARKVRCNGDSPCAGCEANDQECSYGSEANSRGKSDIILDGVLRVEAALHEMKATIASIPKHHIASPSDHFRRPVLSPGTRREVRTASFSSSIHGDLAQNQRTPRSDTLWPVEHDKNPISSLDNAVLASMHTSATETVLQWPHFDVFPDLRDGYTSIFHLEQSRLPLQARASVWHPLLSALDIDEVLGSFRNTVNFWYPTMSTSELAKIRSTVACGGAEEGEDVELCLSFLTMALGLAGQVTSGLVGVGVESAEDKERRRSRKALADAYFDGALKRLHIIHTRVGSQATHCLFFIALYFAFLRRPLQAWEYINASAAKCLLLLSYKPERETYDDEERIRRIFWACYILESDYLAELPALPQSGISQIESSTPLPGAFGTHTSEKENELSSLYFLACISMRRLLNRVHHLLYARGSGTALDPARFPAVVRELDHQLEEWREVLPQALAFSIDFAAVAEYVPGSCTTQTEAGGFLRQRYLTCRSVIYRPYLMWMLSGVAPGPTDHFPLERDVLRGCKLCLDACLFHILNLRGFGQTCLVDTWICSLSMAGAMLMLLAACRVTTLRDLVSPEVLGAGEHLRGLLGSWQIRIGGTDSPSVQQSLKLISDIDRLIQHVYKSQDHSLASEITGTARHALRSQGT